MSSNRPDRWPVNRHGPSRQSRARTSRRAGSFGTPVFRPGAQALTAIFAATGISALPHPAHPQRLSDPPSGDLATLSVPRFPIAPLPHRAHRPGASRRVPRRHRPARRVARPRDRPGRALGPPPQGRQRLPALVLDPTLRRPHPRRPRGAHGARPPRDSRPSPTATRPSRCASTSSRPGTRPRPGSSCCSRSTARPDGDRGRVPPGAQLHVAGVAGRSVRVLGRGRRTFVLSESLQTRNAVVGSPWATNSVEHPAHQLGDAPRTMVIPVDPERARREFIPIAVAGGPSRATPYSPATPA